VHRIVAVFVAAALSMGAMAADKPGKARVTKASQTVEAGPDGPLLRSSGVLVMDAVTGQTLYAKNSQEVTPIASITKVMTAMVVLDAKLALDEPIQITTDDIDLLKGTKSRLPIGSHFRRDDLMRLALMASDNRAASALGRNYPGGIAAFVDAMNLKAAELGMDATRFVDSSGLSPHNVSSGDDLGKLVAAASRYDLIREYSTTEAVNVTLPDSKRKLSFVNTNRLVRGSDWQIGLSKTGYISESGMCLVMQAIIANQPVVIVLLDSWGKLTRVADAQRIKKWLEKNPTKFASNFRSG
jgi:D-alanyl-D-alanine endopeptidase (penicillin-binding protein 7)